MTDSASIVDAIHFKLADTCLFEATLLGSAIENRSVRLLTFLAQHGLKPLVLFGESVGLNVGLAECLGRVVARA